MILYGWYVLYTCTYKYLLYVSAWLYTFLPAGHAQCAQLALQFLRYFRVLFVCLHVRPCMVWGGLGMC